MWPLRGDKLSIEANPLVGSVDERSSQQWQPLICCRRQALVREVAAGGYAGIRSVGVVVAVANSRLELSQAWTPAADQLCGVMFDTTLQVRVLPNRHGHGYSLICIFPARLGPISSISWGV